MNEIIEKLKDKNYVRAFGLMSKEEQEVYEKAGKKNCTYYDGNAVGWIIPSTNSRFADVQTYAIKPEYQPEPEYVDLEIKSDGKWLYIEESAKWLPCPLIEIHKLPSLPNFICFWPNVGRGYETEKIFYTTGFVNVERGRGHKVYARLRK